MNKACQNDENKQKDDEENEDDSKLLWSADKGVSELQRRQDRRTKRAEVLTQSQSSNDQAVESSMSTS